jgi:HAMP domain-containing protein
MKLLVKFNLVFLIVFAIGLALAATIARTLLREDAKQEVIDRARLLMENSVVASYYTATQVRPLLETQMKYTFLPQSVPQYAATETLKALRDKYPEYHYKPAMLNPTNPRDRAIDWEADIIARFVQQPSQTEFIGTRDTPSGPALYIARAITITNPACLACHSTPAAAPKTMVDHYGPNNGFGWTLNEPLGAHIVSVPMDVPLRRADRALGVVIGLLAAVFVLIGLALNLMLWRLVIRPVSQLSAISDRVSLGELDAPEFSTRSRDEIGVLAESIARMRKSLVHAMKLLDG